ncbi:MAG: TetR/AcrR family transcriptional regulator [Aquincola tertiaricarbonis]|uniref:TetR/AcrR family transcriptional regulator n=1 Tax=Aquincola TaxID=391952 RepID=UPI0006153630|nr:MULTISPECIES: TetR/AcrR family transcriptional regulator [Aquincola]MCR5865720.1 TetR/AcrR family transcriptional regulator [Aquincola sp. J276]
MQSHTKKPRRTAERILDAALELLNRFGEPNVSTTLIAAELGISPGNLYYHYPAKETLINALYERYELAMAERLAEAGSVHSLDTAWQFFHALFGVAWEYRFLYRDLNDLLSKNRMVEARFQAVLERKARAVETALEGLVHNQCMTIGREEAAPLAQCLVVMVSYWLNHEYARDPRRALEPEQAEATLARAVYHVLSLLHPYLGAAARQQLLARATVRPTADLH